MTLSPRRWLVIGIASTVVLIAILYGAVISPAQSREHAAAAHLQTVQTAISADRTQLVQLEALAMAQPVLVQQGFHLTKAIPVGPQTPGMMLQLQHLATVSNVQLSQVRTISTTPVNDLTATAYEVDVVGSFFNVDDFMYRLHRQVSVSSHGTLSVGGRLFAVTGMQLALAGTSGGATSGTATNSVTATLQLLTFSQASTSATSSSTSSGASGATGTSSSSGTTTTPSKSGGLG